MAAHTLTVTFHIRSEEAADGNPDTTAGILIPPFAIDLANACRYQEVDLPDLVHLPDDIGVRRVALAQALADVIERMPARLRRDMSLVLATDNDGDKPKPSRWDEPSGGWVPDPDGTGLVLQLRQGQSTTFAFKRDGAVPGTARFYVAAQAKVV